MNEALQTFTLEVSELYAALLQAAITFGLALLCLFLYRRYRKAHFGWWAVAWSLYLTRVLAITWFMLSKDRIWLYWHQVVTGWTALALLWAALVFGRQTRFRPAYALALLFPPVWSYAAIYRLDNFFLAAGPAVAFLSLVTLWTGIIVLNYWRRARTAGPFILAASMLLWSVHHLDYPFLRRMGAWSPWGYYLDILFVLATATGMFVMVLDDLRRGLAALSALSGDLSRAVPGEDGLARVLERPLSLPAVRGAAVFARRDGGVALVRGAGDCAPWNGAPSPGAETLITRAIFSSRPELAHDWPAPPGAPAPRYAYAVALPIVRAAGATEALVMVGDTRDPFTALDESFLLTLGRQIGAALDAAELSRGLAARTAELRKLSVRMIQQHEEERRRVSLALHDETAQVFSALKLQLGLLRERAPAGLTADFDRMLTLVDEGLYGIRSVTQDLRPSLLDDLGLVPALRSLASDFESRTGIGVTVEAPDALPRLPPDSDLALFRALQEALSNMARHSGARRAAVRITARDGGLSLMVTDDGRGFGREPDLLRLESGGHLGLAGMRERIRVVGGDVDFGAAPGGGAQLDIWVPVEAEA